MCSHSRSSSWTRSSNGAVAPRSPTSARYVQNLSSFPFLYLLRSILLTTFLPPYSSPTSSKAVSSASSAGCKNSSARCARRPKSSAIPSWSKSSQRRRRCWRGLIRSFFARHCICRPLSFLFLSSFVFCFSASFSPYAYWFLMGKSGMHDQLRGAQWPVHCL